MVLKQDVESRIEVKKSKFICVLHRVKSMDEARTFISSLKKDYPAATHYCSAVKIGSLTHSSDDGEPAGTAGRPMLDVLMASEADELCAVVIRYFGGTLLGKGGLVRAYSSSVSTALEQAQFLETKVFGLYQIQADYSLAGKVEAWLHAKGAGDLQTDYGASALFTFTSLEDPSKEIADKFSGAITVTKLSDISREC